MDENKSNNSQTDNTSTAPQKNEPVKAPKISIILLLVFVIGLTIFIAIGIYKAAFPPKAPLQGQMESRTISVASKVPGRVHEVLVKEGDFVVAGQPVAKMSLPDLEAKLEQVKAQERAAQAQQSLVDEGARPQQKEAAKAEWERAQAGADLAYKTYQRISALYKDGLVSKQKYDEVQTNWLASKRQATAAKQMYDIAEIGARVQEKSAAADMTAEARAGIKQVQSLTEDKTLNAPLNAQVDKIILVEGEIAAAGFPVVTLVDLNDQWASFNIREENMPGIKIGKVFHAYVPALGGEKIDYEIYYISPRANYATWRSTRMDSGYDMKTFEVRARPTRKVEDLRPGMSVLVDNF